MIKHRGLLGLCLFGLLTLVGCTDIQPTSDDKMNAKQEEMAAEANSEVGMPGINRFTEKRTLRQIYEKRDQEKLTTYAYIQDMNGRLHHLCDSIGYGFPYGTQFSNPQKYTRATRSGGGYEYLMMPQAEPNGLFMPPTADGTWVQCISSTGKIEPMYVEPHVIVSPWPLTAVDSYSK